MVRLDAEDELPRLVDVLAFLGNCAEDSLDTLNYLHRAESEYSFWQVSHGRDDVSALEDLAPKLEILRGIVEKERLDWEKEQQEERARELDALGYNVPDPGLMQDGAADIEEDEGAIDLDTKEASAQAESLVYRPKNKPGKFQASLRIKSLRQQKSISELRSLSGIFKKETEPDQRNKEFEDNNTQKS
ncbi:hypothetical protein PRZ48_011823 [Zasmidium cellare]|uniref:Uncharacterized protein n=1 Tax=Zasmidium cellare TaxID=395010 RepID=A0ABR0E7F6_ZASCE|nr:hypothetical protein PRZ48_011823 [Zasmidium cellare]